MTDSRELSRMESRVRRAQFKARSERKAKESREQAAAALDRIRSTISDPSFRDLLKDAGVTSAPKRLMAVRSSPGQDYRILDSALDFAVAWKFLYPMFRDPKTSSEIDKNWPGFISQVKDAFISLAVDGPFPD